MTLKFSPTYWFVDAKPPSRKRYNELLKLRKHDEARIQHRKDSKREKRLRDKFRKAFGKPRDHRTKEAAEKYRDSIRARARELRIPLYIGEHFYAGF